MINSYPNFEHEERLRLSGFEFVAGIDEVGRGPIAGPVVAAAIIIDKFIEGVRDSKKLTERKRKKLASIIYKEATDYGIGMAEVWEIQKLGIQKAVYLAFERAVCKLEKVDYLLIDGYGWTESKIESGNIIKGDNISFSIAAASIIAKVYRDELMDELDEKYPNYQFCKNKGYGTNFHIDSIKKFGPCEIHRLNFEPLKSL